MNNPSRVSRKLPLIGAFVLPIWIAIGRGFFGVGGWAIFLTLLIMAPIMFCALIIIAVLTMARPRNDANRKLTRLEARLWLGLIGSSFVYEITLVDGGDTNDSIQSVLTKFAGRSLENVSNYIALVTLTIGTALIIALLVYAIRQLIQTRRDVHTTVAPSPSTTQPTEPSQLTGQVITPIQNVSSGSGLQK